MSWRLNTPISVGEMAAADYTHLKITGFRWGDRGQIRFSIAYGIDDELGNKNSFTKGVVKVRRRKVDFSVRGAEYNSLVQHVSNNGELTFDAVKRGLYRWLRDNTHIKPGSII